MQKCDIRGDILTDKEMKKLSRSELLEIILMLQENQEKLSNENCLLKSELKRRTALVKNDAAFGEVAERLDAAIREFNTAANQYVLRLESEAVAVIESKGKRS